MLRKCTILGLALLVLGGLAYAWLRKQAKSETTPPAGYSLESDEHLEKYDRWYRLTPEQQNQLILELDKDRQGKSPEEIAAEQEARLRANLPRLAAGEMNPGDIADYLYGSHWQDKVAEYQKLKEQEQITQTAAIVCFAIGGTLTGVCLLIWVIWSLARIAKVVKRKRIARRRTVDADPVELKDISHEPSGQGQNDGNLEELATELESDTATGESPYENDPEDPDDEPLECFVIPRSRPSMASDRPTLAPQPQGDDSPVALLLSDEPDAETGWSAAQEWSAAATAPTPTEEPKRKRFTPRPRVLVLGEDDPDELEASRKASESDVSENPLTDQADDLQRQIAEFKEVAQSVQQASREQSAPLGNTLKELAQQVSAIREYAASQQNRVEKLQDGYDWTIIRTFCLRVIRCIDNLENRIEQLADDDELAAHLDEIKDELLFALESSGIEQFRPEVDSDYRGQEKLAEAVKEKEITGDSDQIGKIAKVIRPGYRYMIDEESCKVVRTAQVKLYG